MTTLKRMEERRQRALIEVHDLESLNARRPLYGYEERSLRRSRGLVAEMDEAILHLISLSPAAPAAEAVPHSIDVTSTAYRARQD